MPKCFHIHCFIGSSQQSRQHYFSNFLHKQHQSKAPRGWLCWGPHNFRVQWTAITVNFVTLNFLLVSSGTPGPENPTSLGTAGGSGKGLGPQSGRSESSIHIWWSPQERAKHTPGATEHHRLPQKNACQRTRPGYKKSRPRNGKMNFWEPSWSTQIQPCLKPLPPLEFSCVGESIYSHLS